MPTTYQWTELNPATVPDARYAHAMATDEDGNTLMFGGTTTLASSVNDETWLYDSTAENWTEWDAGHALPRPAGAQVLLCLIFDATANRFLLYGGWHAFNDYSDELWEFVVGSGWNLLDGASDPGPRYGQVMAWADDRLYVFSGGVPNVSGGSGDVYGDLWEWTPGGGWNELTPISPPSARAAGAAIWDGDRFIIWGGGYSEAGNPGATVYYDEVWAYDPATNTWADITPASVPPYLENIAATFVWDTDRGVFFAGQDTVAIGTPLKDETRIYMDDDFTLVTPDDLPTARYLHAMTWDNSKTRGLLHAGDGPSSKLDDTWEFKILEPIRATLSGKFGLGA